MVPIPSIPFVRLLMYVCVSSSEDGSPGTVVGFWGVGNVDVGLCLVRQSLPRVNFVLILVLGLQTSYASPMPAIISCVTHTWTTSRAIYICNWCYRALPLCVRRWPLHYLEREFDLQIGGHLCGEEQETNSILMHEVQAVGHVEFCICVCVFRHAFVTSVWAWHGCVCWPSCAFGLTNTS